MILPNKYTINEANEFISKMIEIIDLYGVITVADVYGIQKSDNPMLDISKISYKDNQYGWIETTLKPSLIGNYRRGYAVELNRPIPIV